MSIEYPIGVSQRHHRHGLTVYGYDEDFNLRSQKVGRLRGFMIKRRLFKRFTIECDRCVKDSSVLAQNRPTRFICSNCI